MGWFKTDYNDGQKIHRIEFGKLIRDQCQINHNVNLNLIATWYKLISQKRVRENYRKSRKPANRTDHTCRYFCSLAIPQFNGYAWGTVTLDPGAELHQAMLFADENKQIFQFEAKTGEITPCTAKIINGFFL